MKTLQGPAIFLAQYFSTESPFDNLDSIAKWAAGLGFKGVQIPTWEKGLFDMDLAATSKDYCDEFKGRLAAHGVVATELATHLQGQLVAVHPAYDEIADTFADASVKGN
ncbi:MAG: sugar phosphate isomerase/epimerase, partial [Planctomycetota bacterium]